MDAAVKGLFSGRDTGSVAKNAREGASRAFIWGGKWLVSLKGLRAWSHGTHLLMRPATRLKSGPKAEGSLGNRGHVLAHIQTCTDRVSKGQRRNRGPRCSLPENTSPGNEVHRDSTYWQSKEQWFSLNNIGGNLVGSFPSPIANIVREIPTGPRILLQSNGNLFHTTQRLNCQLSQLCQLSASGIRHCML
ncbi:uncharacterized protein PADG_11272 [Paracoccidioides brasiliensis Pb18]|uniref:Uncharacterized protein n=1 Tax=Paracoccidioides brasiliensis (strain Pb18) TaxID=502780 RepID=A0A0A0HYK7_PARBD|nr:uncharacterized protein PADG_11272 [Paracoccidioides brasiliensis Pb18]KGM92455.1 hypothetical protein PADG_11272 [Paracoccidioides brasiliensis Pb18]